MVDQAPLALSDAQLNVLSFHQKFSAPVGGLHELLAARRRLNEEPNSLIRKVEMLQAQAEWYRIGMQRADLITEEKGELIRAWHTMDVEQIADALGDLLYVVLGSAVAAGVDVAPIFEEIHASNMTKDVGEFKPIKGPTYKAPDIQSHLRKQRLAY